MLSIHCSADWQEESEVDGTAQLQEGPFFHSTVSMETKYKQIYVTQTHVALQETFKFHI